MPRGAPSLDSYRHGVTGSEWVRRFAQAPGPDHCPRWPFEWVNVSTGEINPAWCKGIRCPVCGPHEARRRARRLAAMRPERLVTLTALAPDYREARAQEARLLRRLRKAGIRVEWGIAHELTKRGQRHAHAVVRGDFIPQRVLSRFASESGMGRVVDVRAIRNVGGTEYALKEALRVVNYATKGTDALAAHLALNGGRVYRTTKGYFREA